MRPKTSPPAERSASRLKMRSRSSRTVRSKMLYSLGSTPSSGSNVLLDSRHGIDQGQVEVLLLGQGHDPVVPRFLGQVEGAPFDIVVLDQRALGHAAAGLIRLDLPRRRLEAVGGMAQEDDAEHRHAVFRRGQLGVGAELIGRFPQVRFKLCKGCQLVLVHGLSAFILCLSEPIVKVLYTATP